MCGIAGIINTAAAPTEAAIRAMIDLIPYRGPDGAGTWVLPAEGVALGHRRLSILDLSEAGHQPMASADRRYTIVFNGEIYNYLEIRAELLVLGHVFRSGSDTEVLLAAYAEWGSACLTRLMGMFAFAIWDSREHELFVARDRLGIKPLYFSVIASGLAFASEVKSLLVLPEVDRVVDTTLIPAYMEFGYVPGSQTLHRGVERLLPGHQLIWREGRVRMAPYWDVEFHEEVGGTFEADTDRVRRLLKESVDLHLRSDVPLGVFLSGGIDSSAVVSLLSPSASSGLKTFSVSYDFGKGYDETPYARAVAARFGTDHHEIRMDAAQFRAMIPEYIWHMDEPVTEAAALSLLQVARLARQHVVVCLSGEGSDELFGGYDFYRYNLAIEQARRLPLLPAASGLAAMVSRALRANKLARYLAMIEQPLERRYRGISSYDPTATQALYSADFARMAVRGSDRCSGFIEGLFTRTKGWSPLNRMLYFDTKTWLVDDLLIKADRMSMAASIELRVPFLDHRLVEAAARLPVSSKIRNGQTKAVLKAAMKGLLPDEIIGRRKMGFPTPLELMFRGELYDYARDLLLSEQAMGRGYFNRQQVSRLFEEHRAGRHDHHRQIWQLVVLEQWHRRFAV